MNNNKGFAPFITILIVALIIVGGTGYYFLKKGETPILNEQQIIENNKEEIKEEENTIENNSETESWNLYENKEYGFSFKYPDGYEIQAAAVGDFCPSDTPCPSFTVRVIEPNRGVPREHFFFMVKKEFFTYDTYKEGDLISYTYYFNKEKEVWEKNGKVICLNKKVFGDQRLVFSELQLNRSHQGYIMILPTWYMHISSMKGINNQNFEKIISTISLESPQQVIVPICPI